MQPRPASAGPNVNGNGVITTNITNAHHPRRGRNRSDPLTAIITSSTTTPSSAFHHHHQPFHQNHTRHNLHTQVHFYNQQETPPSPRMSSNFPIVPVKHLQPIIINGPEDLAKDQFYITDSNNLNINSDQHHHHHRMDSTATAETAIVTTTELDVKNEKPVVEEKRETDSVANETVELTEKSTTNTNEAINGGGENKEKQTNDQVEEEDIKKKDQEELSALKTQARMIFREIEENLSKQCRQIDDFGHKLPYEQKEQLLGRKRRLWDPLKAAVAPREEEFEKAEVAFGRFVHFNRNRRDAGLSEEAVRLLSRFYSGMEEEQFKEVISIPTRPEVAGARADIRRCLENRHLAVLTNLLMMTVEAEQKQQQALEQFTEMLESPKLILPQIGGNNNNNNNQQSFDHIDSKLMTEILALSEEHIRLRASYFHEIKSARTLMVSAQKGSLRILAKLKRRARAHMARKILRENLEKPF